jgi:hypothetical protein
MAGAPLTCGLVSDQRSGGVHCVPGFTVGHPPTGHTRGTTTQIRALFVPNAVRPLGLTRDASVRLRVCDGAAPLAFIVDVAGAARCFSVA